MPHPFQEDTISINHNWVNGCNLANMWHFLQQELRAVQQEVSQWRDTMPDWHRHCQVGQPGQEGRTGKGSAGLQWGLRDGAHQGQGCNVARAWGSPQGSLHSHQRAWSVRPELWSWGHGSRQPACLKVSLGLRQVTGAYRLQDSDPSPAGPRVSLSPSSRTGPCPQSTDTCLELQASRGSLVLLSGQVIMRSCSGINFEEFYHFLKIIAERRLLLLAKGMGPGTMEGGVGTGLGPQQAAFDVSRITEVLASVVAHPDFQKLDTSMFSPQPEELLPQLEEVVATAASI